MPVKRSCQSENRPLIVLCLGMFITQNEYTTMTNFCQSQNRPLIVSPDCLYLAFICKRLKLNFRKLSVEERKWLKKIAEKSDLLKSPKPQRGRR